MNNPKEDILRHLWHPRYLGSANLRTTDNKKIIIKQFGNLERGSGPDFRNAKITIDGKDYTGDIEFHREFIDWNLHQHQNDANYNNVILHLVYENYLGNGEIFTDLKRKIPTVILSQFINRPIDELIEELSKSEFHSQNKTIRCAQKNDNISVNEINSWMIKLFDERIKQKVEKFRKRFNELQNNKWHQLFYEAIFEALGFLKNRNAMKTLAENTDLNYFINLQKNIESSQNQIEAILFYSANLIPNENELLSPTAKIKTHELKSILNEIVEVGTIKKMDKHIWRSAPTRPANSPQIRIAIGSYFVSDILSNKMFENMIEIFSNPITKPETKLIMLEEIIKTPTDNFWDYHYTFDSETNLKHAMLGNERKIDILMNAVVPIAILFGETNNNFVVSENANTVAKIIKTMSSNSINDAMEKQFIKNKISIDFGWQNQSLLQLYNNYCQFDKCNECEIGKIIYN